LQKLRTTTDDCCRIAELLLDAPPSGDTRLTIALLTVLSLVELSVSAVYTEYNDEAQDAGGLARSFDPDWPPHQPITLIDPVAGARAVELDFTTWCYVSGYDASDPDFRNMFECFARREGAQACTDRPIC
jgi:hypothetical protein